LKQSSLIYDCQLKLARLIVLNFVTFTAPGPSPSMGRHVYVTPMSNNAAVMIEKSGGRYLWCALGCDIFFPGLDILKYHLQHVHKLDPTLINEHNHATLVSWYKFPDGYKSKAFSAGTKAKGPTLKRPPATPLAAPSAKKPKTSISKRAPRPGPSRPVSKPKAKPSGSLLNACSRILNKMLLRKCAIPFKEPVDAVAMKLHDYHQIIKRPMDLGTVKTKLNDGEYQGKADFEADVRLVFANCYLYNPPDHGVYKAGKRLEKIFEMSYAEFQEDHPESNFG